MYEVANLKIFLSYCRVSQNNTVTFLFSYFTYHGNSRTSKNGTQKAVLLSGSYWS